MLPKAIPISLLQKPSSPRALPTLPPVTSISTLATSIGNDHQIQSEAGPRFTLREHERKPTYYHQAIRFRMGKIPYWTKWSCATTIIIIGQEVKNILPGSSNPIGEGIAGWKQQV